tara:strand:+ start:16502 stop:17938 length:1437 start_codon:yes stop_codon:yes gene_type:complete
MELNKTYIYENASLKDAVTSINQSGLGTVFIVNKSIKPVGILTDGDIRKALLLDNNLSIPVTNIMNKDFIKMGYKDNYHDILKKISNEIKVIPLVNDEDILVDYATKDYISFIPIAKPLLGNEELSNVIDCIQSGWISSQGSYVDKFEKEFSNFHNNLYSLSVSNGSVALHLALVSLGIGEGDGVIVPNLTFAATINSIIHAGATPIIIDVEHDTWNIDLKKAEDHINLNTKAIMPVHLYGNPSNMKNINYLAKKYNLFVIEDCAEAIGSKTDNKLMGTYGDASTFSFFGNKTITTGEGGMILFKKKEYYNKAKILRDHGMNPKIKYWHDFVGFNYRLTNIQASIGAAQLKRVNEFVSKKREISNKYEKFFSNYNFIKTQKINQRDYSSYWLFSFMILENAPVSKEKCVLILKSKGIDTRPIFYPLHKMKIYTKYRKGKMSNSKFISKHGISLPTHLDLSNGQIEYILESLKEIFQIK